MIKAKKCNESMFYRGFDDEGNESRGYPMFFGKGTFIMDDIRCSLFEIDRDTLCSWTGKNDCNGTPVFEGDIVRYNYEDFDTGEKVYEDYLVQWDREQAGFCISTPSHYYEDGLSGMQNFEVIGNVYKNPDLAEEFYCVRRGI